MSELSQIQIKQVWTDDGSKSELIDNEPILVYHPYLGRRILCIESKEKVWWILDNWLRPGVRLPQLNLSQDLSPDKLITTTDVVFPLIDLYNDGHSFAAVCSLAYKFANLDLKPDVVTIPQFLWERSVFIRTFIVSMFQGVRTRILPPSIKLACAAVCLAEPAEALRNKNFQYGFAMTELNGGANLMSFDFSNLNQHPAITWMQSQLSIHCPLEPPTAKVAVLKVSVKGQQQQTPRRAFSLDYVAYLESRGFTVITEPETMTLSKLWTLVHSAKELILTFSTSGYIQRCFAHPSASILMLAQTMYDAEFAGSNYWKAMEYGVRSNRFSLLAHLPAQMDAATEKIIDQAIDVAFNLSPMNMVNPFNVSHDPYSDCFDSILSDQDLPFVISGNHVQSQTGPIEISKLTAGTIIQAGDRWVNVDFVIKLLPKQIYRFVGRHTLGKPVPQKDVYLSKAAFVKCGSIDGNVCPVEQVSNSIQIEIPADVYFICTTTCEFVNIEDLRVATLPSDLFQKWLLTPQGSQLIYAKQ